MISSTLSNASASFFHPHQALSVSSWMQMTHTGESGEASGWLAGAGICGVGGRLSVPPASPSYSRCLLLYRGLHLGTPPVSVSVSATFFSAPGCLLVGWDGAGEAGATVWCLPGGGRGWQAPWEGQVIISSSQS